MSAREQRRRRHMRGVFAVHLIAFAALLAAMTVRLVAFNDPGARPKHPRQILVWEIRTATPSGTERVSYGTPKIVQSQAS